MEEKLNNLYELISQVQQELNDVDNKAVNNLSAALQDVQEEFNEVYDSMMSLQVYLTEELNELKSRISYFENLICEDIYN